MVATAQIVRLNAEILHPDLKQLRPQPATSSHDIGGSEDYRNSERVAVGTYYDPKIRAHVYYDSDEFDIRIVWRYLMSHKISIPADRTISSWNAFYQLLNDFPSSAPLLGEEEDLVFLSSSTPSSPLLSSRSLTWPSASTHFQTFSSSAPSSRPSSPATFSSSSSSSSSLHISSPSPSHKHSSDVSQSPFSYDLILVGVAD
jgi:hypothetical protein